MSPTPHPLDDPAARGLVRRAARRLARGPAFAADAAEDVEQELLARLLARLRGYDPARSGLAAHLPRLLARAAANLVRDRLAAKRAAAPGPLGRLDPAADGRRPAGPGGPDLVDLRLDAAAVLAGLPADLRALADALAGGATVAAAARRPGRPADHPARPARPPEGRLRGRRVGRIRRRPPSLPAGSGK